MEMVLKPIHSYTRPIYLLRRDGRAPTESSSYSMRPKINGTASEHELNDDDAMGLHVNVSRVSRTQSVAVRRLSSELIQWIKSKSVEPPIQLPESGLFRLVDAT